MRLSWEEAQHPLEKVVLELNSQKCGGLHRKVRFIEEEAGPLWSKEYCV